MPGGGFGQQIQLSVFLCQWLNVFLELGGIWLQSIEQEAVIITPGGDLNAGILQENICPVQVRQGCVRSQLIGICQMGKPDFRKSHRLGKGIQLHDNLT